jgi:mono/diheme cytochrome c family protein
LPLQNPKSPMNRFIIFAAMLFALLVAPIHDRVTADEPVDFARQILPILSNKCFVCHGPDTHEDETDLRLDSLAAATADRGGYQAINPTEPAESAVLLRIHSAADPMPPADAEKQLTAAERDLISRWIRAGGQYAQHWSFVPPTKSDRRASIDDFIRAKLNKHNVDFAPQAQPATLARRTALILTGLPPEPDQLDEFLADPSDAGYERFVDKLLASPKFGEHQARYWLDAVRYGDTHGLHLDNRRGIYPYRDWVVKAFNDNLPLDDFITWQLAGDLLPDPTLEQQVATGFVRMNPSTGEGGAIADEFQAKNNFDRVETFGTVFLGLTLTCARCHTHKYDPIEQTEYYRLFAFFNNTTEPALDGNSYTYGPTIKVPDNLADWQRWSELEIARQEVLDQAAAMLESDDAMASMLAYAESTAGWKHDRWQISKPLAAGDPAPQEEQVWSKANGLPGAISGRNARGKLPGEGQAVWVRAELQLPAEQSVWLTFSGGVGTQVFVDDATEPVATKPSTARTAKVTITLPAGKHRLRLKIIGGGNLSALEAQVSNAWDALAKTKRWDACSKQDRLLMSADPHGPLAAASFRDAAQGVAEDIRQIQANFTTSLIAQDLANPRQTRMLKRGEYDQPVGEPLEPGTVAVLGAWPEDAPKNRLGLAGWLTSPEHPLTTRVLINRIWQRTFGDALVRSPEDFGLQGQQPTHPELLDWLAVELRESGWDLKQLLRLMVTSDTFRQSSARRGDIDDPENRLFARGPSFRMDAEVLRDLGLWSSGLLDPQMGGEGVKPYQPGGMWQALAHPASNTKQYVRDQGRKLYRRSLYVYWKRTSPHPMMTLFDAPDRESSCVRRSRTSTALQSLGLLNETQRIEMARTLAERLLREGQNDAERLTMLFRMFACREPNQVERAACSELLAAMKQRYQGADADAIALLSIGEVERDPSLPITEQAAWTQVCITVLASDIAIMIY